MNLKKIKLDLVKLIKHKTGVSFVEIENYFDEIGFNTKVIYQYVERTKI